VVLVADAEILDIGEDDCLHQESEDFVCHLLDMEVTS